MTVSGASRLIVLAVAMAAQSTGAATADFPCERLGDDGYRIFEGIGAPAGAQAPAAVRLRKGAVLAAERYPLQSRLLTFDDSALATDGGKVPALPFRAYRIDGKPTFCTSSWRETIFGSRDRDGNYMLRCLFDEDGDGRYERFRAYGELVSYNMRTGKRGQPSGSEPTRHDLPKAVALIESESVRDPNAAFAPRIVSEIRVGKVTANEVTLRFISHVATLPGRSGEIFRGASEPETVTIPLREGNWSSPAGRSIALSRKGRDWYATAAPASGSTARLLCGGSVVDTGTSFTIMSDGGMSVIGKDIPPPS